MKVCAWESLHFESSPEEVNSYYDLFYEKYA